MTRRSFTAAVNRGLRAVASAERARVRSHASHLREMERIAKAKQKLALENYVGTRQMQVDAVNAAIAEQVSGIANLLKTTSRSDHDVDLKTLHKIVDEDAIRQEIASLLEEKPQAISYRPKALGWLSGLSSKAKAEHEERVTEGKQRFEAAENNYNRQLQDKSDELERLRQEVQAHNKLIDQFATNLSGVDVESLVMYAELLLNTIVLPDGFPRLYRAAIVPASMQLVVEFDMPKMDDVVPEAESYKFIKTSDSTTPKKRSAKARLAIYMSGLSQLPLAILSKIFNSKYLSPIDTVVLSGFIDTIDPGTGTAIRPCLVSVRTTRDEFALLHLENVDPVACLKRLRASVSRSPTELVPVKPVVDFDMVDPRFVDEEDILSTLDSRPNLMELTPGEFESLITNLFQSMGLDTKLTQASRDGGIDCVAFDPRPVLGGKVVVQAKRYRNTVGVSAVRDLFGTMHNEGASKGILVTTSGFGKAAYEFANGKPMELLTGENLLYLLREHAHIEAKIEVPQDWVEPSQSAEQ